MTELPDEPDWNLLPHQPLKFFGLDAGFTARELKQRYHVLIRLFKPERHPQEFQRIRAAYERLDGVLRYGTPISLSGLEAESDKPTATAQSAAATFEIAEQHSWQFAGAERAAIIKQIAAGDAAEAYREISARLVKSQHDYYALAVMSDVVVPENRSCFADWIVEGLAAHPHDIGLLQILSSYFRGQLSSDGLESLLIACSKVAREDWFFQLTEPAWLLLLRTQPFENFRVTLRACEVNVCGISIDWRLGFYLQILRSAAWVADDDWLAEACELVESNFKRFPVYLDSELELLSRIRSYRAVRERFTSGGEWRRQLDGVLRDYFTLEPVVAVQGFLRCQNMLKQDPDGLAAAFHDFAEPSDGPFCALWSWVSGQVLERGSFDQEVPVDMATARARMAVFLRRAEWLTDFSWPGVKWNALPLLRMGVATLCVVGIPLMLCFISSVLITSFRGLFTPNDPIYPLATATALIIGPLIGVAIYVRIRTRYWAPLELRLTQRCYQRLRKPLLEYHRESHMPTAKLCELLATAANRDYGRWMAHFACQDMALPMMSIARRFVA